uniref:Fanconi-associated nuclease n=1 Tax=Parastrongyloides trichosuri TaxID=131310 RepID=A0A0N4ZF72_PARTI
MDDFSQLLTILERKIKQPQGKLSCYHFLRTLYNVFNNLTPDTLLRLYRSHYFKFKDIVDLNETELSIFITFYNKGSSGFSLNILKNWKETMEMNEIKMIIRKFLKKGLITMIQEDDIKLIDVLTYLSNEQLIFLHGKYCKFMTRKVNKEDLIKDIIDRGKQRNLIGRAIGFEMKSVALECIGGIYKIYPSFHCVITTIFALHYPDLMDFRFSDNFKVSVDSNIGKEVLNKLALFSKTVDVFKEPNNVKLLDIYDNLGDILLYIQSLEVLSKIMQIKFTGSAEFGRYVRFAVDGLRKNGEELKNWLNKNLPSKILKFNSVSVMLYIMKEAAEIYMRDKRHDITEEIYEILTEDIEYIPFIGSKEYSEWWIRRVINYKFIGNKNEQVKLIEKCDKYKEYIREAYYDDIQERKSKMTPILEQNIFHYPTEKVQLEALSKTGDSGIKNQFYIRSGVDKILVSVEEAAFSYIMNRGDFTHGGIYENEIWIETFYLLFGDIVNSKKDTLIPYFHELTNSHPLLGTVDFIKYNKDDLIDRCNNFYYGNIQMKLKIIQSNMDLYINCYKNGDKKPVFTSPSSFLEFLGCLNVKGLLLLCLHRASQNTTLFSGFPDIVAWNIHKKYLYGYEVKGPGDRLSNKQKLAFKIMTNLLEAPTKCFYVESNSL